MATAHTVHHELSLACIQGVAVELRNALPRDWRLSQENDSFVIAGDAREGYENDVWRIARFVAYPAFVGLSRTRKDDVEVRYELLSQSARGPAFRVEFVLRVPAGDAG